MCASTRRLNSNITRARRCGLVAAQAGCARSAASTALPTSGVGRQPDPRLHLAGAGVEDVAERAAALVNRLAVDEMGDVAHS